MHRLHQFILAASSIFLGGGALAQRVTPSPELRDFTEQRIRHQKFLSLSLGSYALANIAVGAVAAGQTSGETKYVHKMNVYWNLVNLGIAGAGLLRSRKKRAESETLADAVREHEKMKQVLLLNTGLDLAYVVGGGYLRERANTHPDKAESAAWVWKVDHAAGRISVCLRPGQLFCFQKPGRQTGTDTTFGNRQRARGRIAHSIAVTN